MEKQKLDLDLKKRSRRGPAPLEAQEARTHCVSVRLNAAELEKLDKQRSGMQRGEYLRVAALHRLPMVVPETNKLAWVELEKLADNLNQYQGCFPDQQIEIGHLLKQIKALRNDLLGQFESKMESIYEEQC